jgi:hypothetical protein
MTEAHIDLKTGQLRSRRLPPYEAWKRPDKWLDLCTGLARRDVPKLVLPTDDRGLTRPDEVVELMNDMYFWGDYDWPFEAGDSETKPDAHHFYYYKRWYSAAQNNGSEIPHDFRELPTSVGVMPRQFHNAIHDFTLPVDRPDFDVMEDYLSSYKLAHVLFKRLFETSKSLNMRTGSISPHPIGMLYEHEVGKGVDPVDEAFMYNFFEKHFKTYSLAAELFQTAQSADSLYWDMKDAERKRAEDFIGSLGSLATKKYFDFTSLIQAA